MAKTYDPIAPVAEEISEEAALLCFDEFQVRKYLQEKLHKITSNLKIKQLLPLM